MTIGIMPRPASGIKDTLGTAVEDFGEAVTVRRFHAPVIRKGKVISEPLSETFEVLGSVQPMSAREISLLPEGLRNEGTAAGFFSVPLRTAVEGEGGLPDQIEHKGVVYQVASVSDWINEEGHVEAVLTRVDR